MAFEVPDANLNNPALAKAYARVAKAEQMPIQKIDEKIAKIDNKAKLVQDFTKKVGDMKDSIAPFKSPQDFREVKGISSHADILNVTAVDKTKAVAGSYEFEVMGLANSASIMTEGLPDKDKSQVGVGYISFQAPDGETRDIYINSENNTLDGVAATINRAGIGVKAIVVNDGTDADNPWRLVVSGEKPGWKNDFTWPEFNLIDGDLDWDKDMSREGKSAMIKLNGQPMMLDDNKLNDIIPGVSLSLLKASPGQVVKVDITPDVEKIGDKMKGFVEKTNAVLSFIQNQNKVNEESRKDPAKALAGDSVLTAIESRLRGPIQRSQAGFDSSQIQRLQDVGVTFNRSGTLEFDGKKFQAQLENHFDEVADLFSGAGPLSGFANEISELAAGITRPGSGMMTVRDQSLRSEMKRLNDQKEHAEKKAEEHLQKIRTQFSKTEGAMSEMQNMQARVGGLMGGG